MTAALVKMLKKFGKDWARDLSDNGGLYDDYNNVWRIDPPHFFERLLEEDLGYPPTKEEYSIAEKAFKEEALIQKAIFEEDMDDE